MPVEVYPEGYPCLIEPSVKIHGTVHVCAGSFIRGEVEIGDGTQISHCCTIISNTHGLSRGLRIIDQPTIHRRIFIGEDVLVGAGVVILGGATIGDGAVVGAGSVVMEGATIPAYQIWSGVPARFLRIRPRDEQ